MKQRCSMGVFLFPFVLLNDRIPTVLSLRGHGSDDHQFYIRRRQQQHQQQQKPPEASDLHRALGAQKKENVDQPIRSWYSRSWLDTFWQERVLDEEKGDHEESDNSETEEPSTLDIEEEDTMVDSVLTILPTDHPASLIPINAVAYFKAIFPEDYVPYHERKKNNGGDDEDMIFTMDTEDDSSEPATDNETSRRPDGYSSTFQGVFPEVYDPERSKGHYNNFRPIFETPTRSNESGSPSASPSLDGTEEGYTSEPIAGTDEPTSSDTNDETYDSTDLDTSPTSPPVSPPTLPPTSPPTLPPTSPPTASPTEEDTIEDSTVEPFQPDNRLPTLEPTRSPTSPGDGDSEPDDRVPTVAPTPQDTRFQPLQPDDRLPTLPPTSGGTLNDNTVDPLQPDDELPTLTPTEEDSRNDPFRPIESAPTAAPSSGGTQDDSRGDPSRPIVNPPTLEPSSQGTGADDDAGIAIDNADDPQDGGTTSPSFGGDPSNALERAVSTESPSISASQDILATVDPTGQTIEPSSYETIASSYDDGTVIENDAQETTEIVEGALLNMFDRHGSLAPTTVESQYSTMANKSPTAPIQSQSSTNVPDDHSEAPLRDGTQPPTLTDSSVSTTAATMSDTSEASEEEEEGEGLDSSGSLAVSHGMLRAPSETMNESEEQHGQQSTDTFPIQETDESYVEKIIRRYSSLPVEVVTHLFSRSHTKEDHVMTDGDDGDE